MTRVLIYLFPAMIDVVFGTIFYVCPLRLAEGGASAVEVGGILTAWAISYMIFNQIVGLLVNSRNAPWMLIGSSVCIAIISGLFVIVPGVTWQYLFAVLIGIAGAFFFGPFQAFMKAVESGRPFGLARSTGMYTFAWSFGLACGPFFSGFIWREFGWQWCYAVTALMGLATAVGVFFLKHHAHSSRYEPSPKSSSGSVRNKATDYSKMPDYAWLGWIASGIGCVAVAMLRGVFPKCGIEFDVSKFDQGMIMAVLCFSQSITGLFLCRSRFWMYKPVSVGLFGACGVLSLIVFGLSTSPGLYYVAAILFGIYSGGFFFYFVFHSLVHPNRSSRYVAINESVVGGAGIAGPMLGGVLADALQVNAPFYFAAVVVLAAVAFQVIVHGLKRATRPA